MYKKLFMTAAILAACIHADAQTIAPDFKGTSNKNPISSCVFCADPTALEYNGRLYVYGTNDHQEFIANGKKGDNSYGNIKSLVVFSTDDMMNSVLHGSQIHGTRAMVSRGHRPLHGATTRKPARTSSSSTSVTAVTALAY